MAMVTVGNETRPGSRAVAKYVRGSAFKAREVLDLVRGKSYSEAREILTFSERRVSDTIAKCLDSAVANAEHNDDLDGDELFIAACYADEGPTLKRFRPRARGRAGRINKRTCHITVVVARYTEEEIAAIDARLALKGTGRRSSAAEARRRRVAASRERDAERTEDHDHDHDHDHDDLVEDDLLEDEAELADEADLVEDEAELADEADLVEDEADLVEDEAELADEAVAEEEATEDEAVAEEEPAEEDDEPVAEAEEAAAEEEDDPATETDDADESTKES